MYNEMKTVTEILETLREQHYIHNLTIKDEKIVTEPGGEEFNPEDLIIESTYRYEGDSDPSDSAIVYAISSKGGMKGVLVDSYGANAEPKLAKIIGNIPVREVHELQVSKTG